MTRADNITLGLCIVWVIGMLWVCVGASEPILAAIATSGTADWVSAIATFSAVGTALFIAGIEGRRASQAREQARSDAQGDAARHVYRIVSALVDHAEFVAVRCKDADWNPTAAELSLSVIDHLKGQLELVGYGNLPHPAFASEIQITLASARVCILILEGSTKLKIAGPKPDTSSMFARSVMQLTNSKQRYFALMQQHRVVGV